MQRPLKQTLHVRDATISTSAISAFRFYGCSMIIRKPIYSEDMAYFLYDLSFLGLWMYGYATFSFNQIFNHLKFWPAFTAVATTVLKVKIVLDKRRWTDFYLKQLWIICIVRDCS